MKAHVKKNTSTYFKLLLYFVWFGEIFYQLWNLVMIWKAEMNETKITKDSIERIVPIYGELLEAISAYKAEHMEPERQSFFPRYCQSRGSDSASNLLNQRHLDSINRDPTFKMHGLRNTLQSKFDAALLPNSISGYLIGWRDRTTIGMQVAYKSGYPHEQMLKYMKQGHDITDWALRR